MTRTNGDPHQQHVVEADTVVAVLKCENALDFVRLDHRLEDRLLEGDPAGDHDVRRGGLQEAVELREEGVRGRGVTLDENLVLYANTQTDAQSQSWSGWRQIGTAPGFGQAAMDYNADGSLSYFQGESRIDGVQFISQLAPDSPEWSTSWSMLADNGIYTYGIVRDLTPPETT